MTDFARSLPALGRRFPDEAACAEWLLERRWGSGLAWPACGRDRFWRLGRKVLTLQCRACGRETSVTAGHGHAPQPPAAEGLVHRRLAGGDAPERDVGPPAVAAARAGQLRVGLAAAAQAAGGGGRPPPGGAWRAG